MNRDYQTLKEHFPDINIRYYADFDILKIKCIDLEKQLNDLKKIIKILIFEIQSKEIEKDVIIIEFTDKDFLSNNIISLLNIMKFTKTSHYFNLIIKNNNINDRINFVVNNYTGININKEIKLEQKGEQKHAK